MPEQGQQGTHRWQRGQGAGGQAAPSAQGFSAQDRGKGWGGVTLQGALDLFYLTESSSALAAMSPEREAWFCLDSTALLLGPGTTTAPLALRPHKFTQVQGGGSHLPLSFLNKARWGCHTTTYLPRNYLPSR